ncbi:MAG: Flp pilus assembly protein CpaB [Thermodesulfobacteriota bacterium]
MAAKPRAVFIIGVIAVAIAAVASIYLYSYLKSQEERVLEAVATTDVVVARMAIPVGTAIELANVEAVAWPKASMPPGALTSATDAVGRVTLMGVQPGDPITEIKLMPTEGPTGILSYKIPEGHRAMTVGVDRVSGVAGFISPGNKVDVIVTTTPPGKDQPISKIILQNVPALATGHIIEQAPDGKPVEVPTVTMDLTPENSEKLALASTQGRLQLLLRKAGDTEELETVGATMQSVLAGDETLAKKKKAKVKTRGKRKAAAKRIVKPRSTKVSVEVLRDGQRTTETFRVKKEAL